MGCSCNPFFSKPEAEAIGSLNEGNINTRGGDEPIVSAAKHGNFDVAVKLSSKQRIIKIL